jgi:hypothetical protein
MTNRELTEDERRDWQKWFDEKHGVTVTKREHDLMKGAWQAALSRSQDELESHKSMLGEACHDLGLIHEALGLDPDEAGGAAPILQAIEELKRARSQDVARVAEGWKLVPIEPTETMVVAGFESWPDEFFSSPEEWEAFDAMSGCQQAAHKAKLCYAAMLAAAQPPQAGAITINDAALDTLFNHALRSTTGRDSFKKMARELLAPAAPAIVPEGCTPADAAMLRAANHQLAAENDYLRRRLRPFAQLASSPLSWAMVEYCIEGDPEKQTLQAPQMQRAFNRAADALREDAAPAPAEPKAEQPTIRFDGDEKYKPTEWTRAEWNVGRWLSAAMEDDSVCAEMKRDVNAWFAELGAREQHVATLSDVAGYELYQKAARAANGVKKPCSYEAWCGEFVRQLRALLAANNGGSND